MPELYFTADYWINKPEEKIEKMKYDKFKKDYPIFSNLDFIIQIIKTRIIIYSEDIMKEIRLNN